MAADDVAVCGRDTVPMIGPRSRAVSAPQWMGKCSLRSRLRMRGKPDMVSAIGTVHDANPKRQTARRNDGPGFDN